MGELDELLAEWARSQRLEPGQAAAVRRAIVTERPGLPATWWGDFNTRMSRIMVQATRPRLA